MEFKLKYNVKEISFRLAEENYISTLMPNEVSVDLIEEVEVRRAMQNPIGSKRLKDIVCPGDKIAIVTSDISRPMPSYKVLPTVIEELKSAGVEEKDITVVLALGIHRKHSEEERRRLVGEEVYCSNITIIDSDKEKCVRIGYCRNGTPVDIFEPVMNADKRIALGNIEFHYFAGYSGGNKALMPGVSSYDAIQANHMHMLDPNAIVGNLDTNPIRQDIEEITDFIPIHFIVNVVLNDRKQIIKAVAGDHVKAHREGCRFLDMVNKVSIKEKADIVILSPGGYPKDINLYQAQKGLDNSKHAVKDGGIIIWCASAAEGFGESNFEKWMIEKSPNEMIEELRRKFVLGAHKAAFIAMTLQKAQIYLVSELDPELVKKINMTPFESVQEALDHAIDTLGSNSKVIIMPEAGSTLPVLE
ncbi:MAG: nickel-dependent lactate racemase [Eubacteriales bacterium]|nr:nickel-dependent lactate racemase [Eubacteriales bacterium]